MSTTHRPLTVTALLLCMFMAAMEATVVATAMPTVVADLGGIELYGWVGAVYMLASTVTIPLYGKLADLYGRKPLLYFGILLFMLGSIASGLSGSMYQLIGFRAVQGFGAGALQPIALTVVGDLYAPAERARVQGLFGAVWGFAGIAGPLLGGVIVKALSWHWVFFLNVPFGALAALILAASFRESVESRDHRLDVGGALVLSGGIVATLLFTSGVRPLLSAALAVILLILFIYIERRATEPILPMSLLRRPVIAVSSVAGAILGAAMMATLTYVPLFIQGVLQGSPTDAGSAITPMLIGWPIAATLSGKLIVRIGYRPMVRTGAVIVFLSTLLLALKIDKDTTLWLLRASMGALGVGLGLANTALIIAVQDSVDWQQRGVATASTMFFRLIGGAIAVGALGALLVSSLDASIPSAQLNELLSPEHGRALGSALTGSIVAMLMVGLRRVFWAVAVCAAFGVLAALAFPRRGPERAVS